MNDDEGDNGEHLQGPTVETVRADLSAFEEMVVGELSQIKDAIVTSENALNRVFARLASDERDRKRLLSAIQRLQATIDGRA